VYINSSFQVMIKMQSAHMAGTFIKTKKCKDSKHDYCSLDFRVPIAIIRVYVLRRAPFRFQALSLMRALIYRHGRAGSLRMEATEEDTLESRQLKGSSNSSAGTSMIGVSGFRASPRCSSAVIT
jgi:hypothetical protein